MPKLFCQEGHQRGEEAQAHIGTGEQDLRGSWGTGYLRQHWLHRFLRRKLTGSTTATPCLCHRGAGGDQLLGREYAKGLNITGTMLSLGVQVNRPLQ